MNASTFIQQNFLVVLWLVATVTVAEDRPQGATLGTKGVLLSDLPADFWKVTTRPTGQGLYVKESIPNGPAQLAGIEPLDVIFRVADTRIENAESLPKSLAPFKPGDTIHVWYRRMESTGPSPWIVNKVQVTLCSPEELEERVAAYKQFAAEKAERAKNAAVKSTRPLESTSDKVWVEGYTRKDGTKVAGYWRSKSSGTELSSKPSASSSDRIWVEGYTRKDGTKVKGHWRSK